MVQRGYVYDFINLKFIVSYETDSIVEISIYRIRLMKYSERQWA